MVGPGFDVSRRFGLWQGVDKAKCRSIDDMSESFVNEAFMQTEKLQLLDLDVLAAVARLLERLVTDQGACVNTPLSTRTVLVHEGCPPSGMAATLA